VVGLHSIVIGKHLLLVVELGIAAEVVGEIGGLRKDGTEGWGIGLDNCWRATCCETEALEDDLMGCWSFAYRRCQQQERECCECASLRQVLQPERGGRATLAGNSSSVRGGRVCDNQVILFLVDCFQRRVRLITIPKRTLAFSDPLKEGISSVPCSLVLAKVDIKVGRGMRGRGPK
jgi:hypothetical protein